MVNINIEIPEDLHKKIKIFCAMNDLTLKDFIINTLKESVDKNTIKNSLKKQNQ